MRIAKIFSSFDCVGIKCDTCPFRFRSKSRSACMCVEVRQNVERLKGVENE